MIDPTSLEIVTAPHPALTSKALPIEPVSAIDDNVRAIARRMVELMLAGRDGRIGIGLAANQVGVLLRIAVVHVPGKKTDWKHQPFEATREPLVLINPVVYPGTIKKRAIERCLSHPGVAVDVERSESIEVSHLDENGLPRGRYFCSGLLARCIQHEVDHLDGISIVDKMGARQ